MGDSIEGENAAFWLPSHFLTDDDFFADHNKEKLHNQKCYDLFNKTGFGSDQFDSPVSSTDNDENNEDDCSLLSNLTRYLARASLHDSHNNKNSTPEKPWVFSTSPQSTLTGFGRGWSNSNRSGFSSNGSPNGPSRVPSPPLTPELKNDAAWDLLYEAAGQVARLKMNAVAAQMNNKRALLGAPRHSRGFTPATNKSSHLQNLYNQQYEELKWAQNINNLGSRQERENKWSCNHQQRRSCGGGGALGLPQSAWPPLTARQPHHNRQSSCSCGAHMNRGIYQGGGGIGTAVPTIACVKRQSTGTGVFLPQHHRPQHSELRTKPAGMQQTKVAQTINMEFEESNSRFDSSGFPTDLEVIMARRNAIMGQQQRRNYATASMGGLGHEIHLPTDWTY